MSLIHVWVSIAIFLFGGLAGFAFSWGVINQKVQTLSADMGVVKQALGLGNGAEGGRFVLHRECIILERSVRSELAGIKERLSEIERSLTAIHNK